MKISAEQVRNIYPEEDPRKFNSHVDEQEIAEYIKKDHSQPITGVNSADKEHIRPARKENEKPPKDYPSPKILPVILGVALTIGAWFFINTPVIMFAIAFGASLTVIPNYKSLNKVYPRLGFNPVKALMIIDVVMMVLAALYWIGSVVSNLLGLS